MLPVWSMFQEEFVSDKDFKFVTDATGGEGYEARWQECWIVGSWPVTWIQQKLIACIELLEFISVAAVVLWGSPFQYKSIVIRCDNKGVVFTVYCLSTESVWFSLWDIKFDTISNLTYGQKLGILLVVRMI